MYGGTILFSGLKAYKDHNSALSDCAKNPQGPRLDLSHLQIMGLWLNAGNLQGLLRAVAIQRPCWAKWSQGNKAPPYTHQGHPLFGGVALAWHAEDPKFHLYSVLVRVHLRSWRATVSCSRGSWAKWAKNVIHIQMKTVAVAGLVPLHKFLPTPSLKAAQFPTWIFKSNKEQEEAESKTALCLCGYLQKAFENSLSVVSESVSCC